MGERSSPSTLGLWGTAGPPTPIDFLTIYETDMTNPTDKIVNIINELNTRTTLTVKDLLVELGFDDILNHPVVEFLNGTFYTNETHMHFINMRPISPIYYMDIEFYSMFKVESFNMSYILFITLDPENGLDDITICDEGNNHTIIEIGDKIMFGRRNEAENFVPQSLLQFFNNKCYKCSLFGTFNECCGTYQCEHHACECVTL